MCRAHIQLCQSHILLCKAPHSCVGYVPSLAQLSIQLCSIQLCRASGHSMQLAGFSIQLCRAQHRAVLAVLGNGLGRTLDIPTKAGVEEEAETIHSRRLTVGTRSREREGEVLAEWKCFITEISSG